MQDISRYGLESLEALATKISMNEISIDGQPIVVEEVGGIAIIDGSNLLGVTVGNYCASKAMHLASRYGIGFVVLRNTNSVGPGQFYAKQMVEVGMKGIIINGSTLSYASNQLTFEIEENNISDEIKNFLETLIEGNTEEKSLVYPTQRVRAYKMRYARTGGGFVYLKHMYDRLVTVLLTSNNLFNCCESRRELSARIPSILCLKFEKIDVFVMPESRGKSMSPVQTKGRT
uniref:Uncharacterized protein n=1 Tax=Meloidogyne javanica TaxID=6303 RepID=A0A915LLC8_MELJA